MNYEYHTVALLFSDIAGYSKLQEPQLRIFVEKVLPKLGSVVDEYRDDLVEVNTWGDAIFAVTRRSAHLASFALALVDFFKHRPWEEHGLPQLQCRLGLHAGAVLSGHDPIRNQHGILGTTVNLAARIEPVTAPNEIWVTNVYRELVDQDNSTAFVFESLGQKELAKGAGKEHLYRLSRADNPTSPSSPKA